MEINLWDGNSGISPVLKFLRKISKDERKRVERDIDHLAQQGLSLLNSSKMKKLKGYNGLYELKSITSDKTIRIFFCISGSGAWLLEGCIKKDNRTRQKHIDKALRRSKTIKK